VTLWGIVLLAAFVGLGLTTRITARAANVLAVALVATVIAAVRFAWMP
jgi:hypothetical protein